MTALRTRMTEDMKIRNLALTTQVSYLEQVSLFARHFNKSPEILGRKEIRTYQLHLAQEKKLSPSSLIVAVSALRFLYNVTLHREWNLDAVIPAPKMPQKLPIIHTQPGGGARVSGLRKAEPPPHHPDLLLCRRPSHFRSPRSASCPH